MPRERVSATGVKRIVLVLVLVLVLENPPPFEDEDEQEDEHDSAPRGFLASQDENDSAAPAPLSLVPKLRLGMPVRAKLCFAWRGCSAGGRAPAPPPPTPPPGKQSFPPKGVPKQELGNESLKLMAFTEKYRKFSVRQQSKNNCILAKTRGQPKRIRA